MPELPEVETVRTQLEKYIVGHKINSLELIYSKTFSGDPKDVEGAKFIDVKRFGKALSLDLDNDTSILIHIKLTGQLLYRGPNLPSPKLSKKIIGGLGGPHTLIVFHLDKNGFLYYNDIRRFGWVKIVPTKDVMNNKFIGLLGPEPMKDLTLEKFTQTLKKTKRAIKTLLMDQAKIAGVGNIYANDALWLSQIHPLQPANSLNDQEIKNLYDAIESVLKKGLESGGASELAFVTPDGSEGTYQKRFLAYGMQGKECPRCKTGKFEKFFAGGRGTYICPTCQQLK